MSETNDPETPGYLLPLGRTEIARLHAQARYLDTMTNPLLARTVRPGMHCVELGPGIGASTEVIRHTLGQTGSLTVVDQGRAFLDYVAHRLEWTGNEGVRFIESTAEAFAFPPGRDLIFGRAVLHHTVDPAAIVRRAADALAPGGVLVFQEPVMSGIFRHTLPDAIAALWRGYIALGEAAGFDFDVGDDLGEMALDAGLEIVEMAGFEPFLVNPHDRGVYPQLLAELRDGLLAGGHADAAALEKGAAGLAELAASHHPLPYVPFVHCIAMRPRDPAG